MRINGSVCENFQSESLYCVKYLAMSPSSTTSPTKPIKAIEAESPNNRNRRYVPPMSSAPLTIIPRPSLSDRCTISPYNHWQLQFGELMQTMRTLHKSKPTETPLLESDQILRRALPSLRNHSLRCLCLRPDHPPVQRPKTEGCR